MRDAERMNGGPAHGVAVTADLFRHLPAPAVIAGLAVTIADDPPEEIEIPGPDRVRIDVSGAPVVVFVPVPPQSLHEGAQLEMYNRLRWYGLSPDEGLAGSMG